MSFLNVDGQWKLILEFTAPDGREERFAELRRLRKDIDWEEITHGPDRDPMMEIERTATPHS